MRRILVAGAGGGIGLALVDALAARADVEQVYALHRHLVSSTSDRVTWLCAEFDQEGALQAIVQRIRQEGGLDTLLVASGLLHGVGLAPEKSLSDLEVSHLLELYRVNAVIPLMLLKACQGLFHHTENPIACVLSAQVGSIGDNRLGGWYGYRMAKAALNMAVRTAAIELARNKHGPTVVAVHPGTTRTALSYRFVRRRRQPVVTPKEAAERLLHLVEGLDRSDNGTFLKYDGMPLPW